MKVRLLHGPRAATSHAVRAGIGVHHGQVVRLESERGVVHRTVERIPKKIAPTVNGANPPCFFVDADTLRLLGVHHGDTVDATKSGMTMDCP